MDAAEARIVQGGFRAHPLPWLLCVAERVDRGRCLGLAAEMAFWLFLSLLPLAAVGGLITAKIALGNPALLTLLLDSLPEVTRALIAKELSHVAAWNSGKVGVGGGLMFVWLASSGVHSIFDGIELTSGAPPRPWWKKRALAALTCAALSVGLALLALLGAGIGWAWRFADGPRLAQALALESSALGHTLRLVAGVLLSVGLVSGLYRVGLPLGKRRSEPVLPGAVVAVVLQAALGFGYGLYIEKAGDGGAYQAGLASIGVTLIALYLFCLVLLVGAKVNEVLGERRIAAPR